MDITSQEQASSFYIAIAVYESSSDSPHYQTLYEENFMLIKATSDEDAKQKALQLAQQKQTTYKNEYQENITWTVKQVIDVSPVLSENFVHGAELYARFFRNYQAYVAFEPLLSGGLLLSYDVLSINPSLFFPCTCYTSSRKDSHVQLTGYDTLTEIWRYNFGKTSSHALNLGQLETLWHWRDQTTPFS